jgi:hypothetical protein
MISGAIMIKLNDDEAKKEDCLKRKKGSLGVRLP